MQLKTIQQCVIKICLFQQTGTVGEESLCNLLLPQEIRRFTDFFKKCLHPAKTANSDSLNIRRKWYTLERGIMVGFYEPAAALTDVFWT